MNYTDLQRKHDFVAHFGDWLKDKMIDLVLDGETESFEDLLYDFLNEKEQDLENEEDFDMCEFYNLQKFLYELLKVE